MTYGVELRQSRGFYRGVVPTNADTRRTPPSEGHDDSMRPLPSLDATLLNPGNPMLVRDTMRAQGFTGNTCSTCFGVRMKVSGHCEVCTDCGTTTGCS